MGMGTVQYVVQTILADGRAGWLFSVLFLLFNFCPSVSFSSQMVSCSSFACCSYLIVHISHHILCTLSYPTTNNGQKRRTRVENGIKWRKTEDKLDNCIIISFPSIQEGKRQKVRLGFFSFPCPSLNVLMSCISIAFSLSLGFRLRQYL